MTEFRIEKDLLGELQVPADFHCMASDSAGRAELPGQRDALLSSLHLVYGGHQTCGGGG